ncbi:MAG: hypothetical protein EBT15_07145 [Betaproteobacteria bacterium]|nr:hypothetical protein [Betaproteobacteria bacterium]
MHAVQVNQIQKTHGVALAEGKIPLSQGGSTPPNGARSSVVYAWLRWVFLRDYPILRALHLGLLTTFVFLRWTGLALTVLALGQLGDFVVAYRRLRRIRSKK